jgi:SAM-dependent methyltransferase
MYSTLWFETFAATVPKSATEREVNAIVALLPQREYPRVLDVGCGIGRTVGPLVDLGYDVTGVDVSVEALRMARRSVPTARYVAIDQRDLGALRCTLDGVIVLWNSFGYGTRADDVAVLEGLRQVLRPAGRLLMDLYHPDWLALNQQSDATDERGASITRWVRDGRCFHQIRYSSSAVDAIEFNVYRPDEIDTLLRSSGFSPDTYLVWWQANHQPSADFARYQVVSTRRE